MAEQGQQNLESKTPLTLTARGRLCCRVYRRLYRQGILKLGGLGASRQDVMPADVTQVHVVFELLQSDADTHRDRNLSDRWAQLPQRLHGLVAQGRMHLVLEEQL